MWTGTVTGYVGDELQRDGEGLVIVGSARTSSLGTCLRRTPLLASFAGAVPVGARTTATRAIGPDRDLVDDGQQLLSP